MISSRQILCRFVVPLFVINLLLNGITTKENVKVKRNNPNKHNNHNREVSLRSAWFGNGIFQERSSPYTDVAEARGYSHQQHGWGWGGGHYHQQHDQNMDLYSLLGGLSFASLLGATIIFLARRNTTGRRKRSIDSIFDDEDEDITQTIVLNSIGEPTYSIDDAKYSIDDNKY